MTQCNTNLTSFGSLCNHWHLLTCDCDVLGTRYQNTQFRIEHSSILSVLSVIAR